ncbi:protocadherin-10 isoform X2 [Silurus meridionalis]|nr:protocadherin-10 isoform X2 [Silurus meridionalis]
MLLIWLLMALLAEGHAQLRYTVLEEQERGTVVGNVAEDLGLDVTKLSARRFQTVPVPNSPRTSSPPALLEVDLESGALVVRERVDREELCGRSTLCLLHLEMFLEEPLELFRVETEVLDVNDNSPHFLRADIAVEISESATPGTRFPVDGAFDPDVGTNSLSAYAITSNEHFRLDVQTQGDGSRYAELVLEKPLDREKQAMHRYVLTAVDGGQPQRTGTALLVVTVLDSNDNQPIFDQSVYSVTLRENSPVGTLVIQLNATDADEGTNGEVVYTLSSHNPPHVRELFAVDARTGRVEIIGEVDYEESSTHQIHIQARDMGPNAVPAHCKVLLKLVDVNDNTPEIGFSTVTESVSERATPGTVVAMLSVSDRDSGENGRVSCELLGGESEDAPPFKLKPSSLKNYYTVVTDGALDREKVESYMLTVVARDNGTPPLTTSKSIRVRVSDENDNAPCFAQAIYEVHVTENNVPGAYIYAVMATDADAGENARVTYSIEEREIQGMSVLTYVSINAENGYVYALRSFDHEQIREFSFTACATDCGTPELTTNTTVQVIVVDQNDNAPSVIAPLSKNGTAARAPLPRSAEPGYLVTRVISTDADDGENARLSYSIAQGNDLGLFRMDWRSGELRTARRVNGGKRDSSLQSQSHPRAYELLIEVRDHGQPPLSCSTRIDVVLVDSAVVTLDEEGAEKEGRGARDGARGSDRSNEGAPEITLVLLVALGSVSSVFLLAMIALAVRCHRKDKKFSALACLSGDCCSCCGSCCSRRARGRQKKLTKSDIVLVQSKTATQVPVEESGTGGGFGTHLHQHHHHCYQVCLTRESANTTDLMFLQSCCSPSRSTTDTEHTTTTRGAAAVLLTDQQPDILSNGSVLSGEIKHQRPELSYLDRPCRVNSSVFQEDIVSSKDSGHGDSEQGDSDHDATNRLHSSDLFSNCTDECKALGHSDRCWMPSFVPSDGRHGADYRSNLHVPGMDAVMDGETSSSSPSPPLANNSTVSTGTLLDNDICGGVGDSGLDRSGMKF